VDVETSFFQERLRYADTTSFTTAMQVLAVAGQWQRCLAIVEQMEVGIVSVVLPLCPQKIEEACGFLHLRSCLIGWVDFIHLSLPC